MIVLSFCVACANSNPNHLHQHHLVPRSCGGSDDPRSRYAMASGMVWHNSHPALVAAGMARAKAKGTKSGKPIGRPAISPHVKTAICEAYRAGEGVSMRGVAKRFGVSVESVRRSLAA
jgi:hypothetical protein